MRVVITKPSEIIAKTENFIYIKFTSPDKSQFKRFY